MSVMKWMVSVVMLLVLAACGGGGGDSGDPPFGGGSGGTDATYTVSVVLSDDVVTASQPSTVTVLVLNDSDEPQANVVVTFSTSLGLGKFTATTALTNAEGKATTTLTPTSSTTVGADTVLASVTIDDTDYTGSVGFQLTATDVTIESFSADVGSSQLGAYAEAVLTVSLGGTDPSAPVSLTLSSACVTQGRATLTPTTTTTSTGTATFTYRDQGCGSFSESDSVQIVIDGSSTNAELTLNLTAPSAASIAFVSASPAQIYLKGSGFDESSIVTFQVRDANGVGVPNKRVVLAPTTLAGGLLIDGGSVPVTKPSDTDGNVFVRINSGTVPTPVRISATLADDTSVSTVSSSLAVAVGLPSQRNFSLAQGTLNIEGFNIDGTRNTYTVIASDRLGNPVPAGTTINFVSEAGQVQAVGTTTTANGLAGVTVNFQSSSPRPDDGRATILAYALGEESFLDENGNNVYDQGEDYQDLGDVFLDRLFNGSYNRDEDQYISLDLDGGAATCRNATSTLLQLGVDQPSRALSTDGSAIATCTQGWGRAYVRRAAQTVFSTSEARLGWRVTPDTRAYATDGISCPKTSLTDVVSNSPYSRSDAAKKVDFYELGADAVTLYGLGATGSFSFLVADANTVALNPMPAGTTITATATSGITVSVSGGKVPSTLIPSPAGIDYSFDDVTAGKVTITVTSPSGLATLFTVPIRLASAPAGSVICK